MSNRIITALDFADSAAAQVLLDRLDPAATRVKIGKQLFTAAGPAMVEACHRRGFDVFLDLKFHDIPNTVASALSVAVSLGVWMVNVHASGGPAMLDAARRAVPKVSASAEGGAGNKGTLLIGVTVLTSLDERQLAGIGCADTAAGQVRRLAGLTVDAGLDGVVCSPQEVSMLRSIVPAGFLTVTPGVRPLAGVAVQSTGGADDDQRRTLDPAAAILAGSDYLVVGRPITQAADPLAVLAQLTQAVESALARRRPSTQPGQET